MDLKWQAQATLGLAAIWIAYLCLAILFGVVNAVENSETANRQHALDEGKAELARSWLGPGESLGFIAEAEAYVTGQIQKSQADTSGEASLGFLVIEVKETPVDAWRRGYRSEGGPRQWEDHFLYNVGTCESGGQLGRPETIDWTPGNPHYRTAFQFHPQTLSTIESVLGEPVVLHDPYMVGKAVAVWIRLIGPTPSAMGSKGGWPVCFWRGLR